MYFLVSSILGPLLFVIFKNNLPQCILLCTPFIFADDAKCLQPISSLNDVAKLQDDISSISSWSLIKPNFFSNLSIFNSGKIQPSCPGTYTVNNKLINTMTYHKDLGIYNLLWQSPMDKTVATKAYQAL